MQPDNEDLRRWNDIARKRNSILPFEFHFASRKEVILKCGACQTKFTRPLIAGQNDPIYVCPSCRNRNYLPVEWNVARR